jgi:hypothetical protein
MKQNAAPMKNALLGFLLALFFVGADVRAAVVTIGDIDGHTAVVDTFGQLTVAGVVPDVAVSFDSQLNTTYDVNTAVTGDGAATLNTQTAQVASTTGTARIESKARIRYRPGYGGIIRFTASFSGAGTGLAGGFTADTGFFVKRAANVSSFCYRNGATDTCEPIPDETSDGFRTAAINWAKLNIFEIQFGYLGVANPELNIYTDMGRVSIAEIDTINRLTSPHIASPNFPVAIYASGAMTVRSASWQGGTVGPEIVAGDGGRPFHFSGTKTLSAATLATVANFKLDATRSAAVGNYEARLVQFEFHVDSPSGNNVGTVQFRIYKNATLAGVASYSAVSDGHSIVEYDTTATYSSGGIAAITSHVGWAGSGRSGNAQGKLEDASKLGLVGYPGDIFTITAQNVGTGTDNVVTRVSFNWEER